MSWPRLTPALTVIAVIFMALPLRADPNRFAVIVGDNRGERDEVTLRYAESDAERVANVLRTLGGFAPENVVVLLGQHATDVDRVLANLNGRLQRYEGQS